MPASVQLARWLRRLLLLGLALAATGACGAQSLRDTRSMTVRRMDLPAGQRIRVDGRLDEAVWQQLEAHTGFTQTDPAEGQPVSERTEARIFFDGDNLYFGFTCYDREPHGIVGRLDAHDARTFSDSVDIFLDPYGDRRTGYWFSVNSRGVQFDALNSEANGFDSTWDGIWQSAAARFDGGWTAEIAIPFKSIRFQTGRAWGINLSRDIVRRNERAHWQFIARFDGFFRPSKAGTLHGVTGVEPGRNLEFIPFVSTRVRRGANPARENDEKYEGGLDIRWGVLKNATANFTFNPDFADTEADEFNITISRFELFFPEKRAFFNEGSNFFTTPLSFFFSRRVGARLPDGRPQRIIAGAKLTGRAGVWSLGALEAVTQAQNYTDPADGLRKREPGANFLVLRLQRDIGENSSLGFLTVNRDQTRVSPAGAGGSTQRVHAVDLNIVRGAHFKSSSQLAFNQNESNTDTGWRRVAFRTGFNYNTDNWQTGAGWKYLGRGVDVSGIGFEPETGRNNAYAFVQYKPFIGRGGVRQIFLELNQDIAVRTDGLLDSSGSDADVRVQFKNFWVARARYSYDRVRFNHFGAANCGPPYPCQPAFAALVPDRIYIEPRIRLFLTSNENRAVSFNYQFTGQKFVQFRENFYGRRQEHFLQVSARMFDRTRLQFGGTWVRELLQDRTPFQNRRLFLVRVNHQFTPKWRVRVLGQLSNSRLGQNFSVNSIVAYDFTARSAAIVGYNYQRRGPGFPGDLGNEFFVKFSYLFNF